MKEPLKLGDLLQKADILKRVDIEEDRFTRLMEAWQKISGTSCAGHTKDLVLKNGILTVTVDSQVWQQELMMQNMGDWAKGMAAASGLNIVKIKITTGGRKRI